MTTQVEKRATLLRVHLAKTEGGLEKNSDVLIDQIRAIDNRRFQKHIGDISLSQFGQILLNLKKILDIGGI